MFMYSDFFFSAEVGGLVYHLQTSFILDLAVTSQTQLCLSNYQCGPLGGFKFICRDNVMTFTKDSFNNAILLRWRLWWRSYTEIDGASRCV